MGRIVGKILGGGAPKAPAPAPVRVETPKEQTPEFIEEERRKRLLAINQQGSGGQLTGAGGAQGQATVARKALLGL